MFNVTQHINHNEPKRCGGEGDAKKEKMIDANQLLWSIVIQTTTLVPMQGITHSRGKKSLMDRKKGEMYPDDVPSTALL